jgi:hypothetical protein
MCTGPHVRRLAMEEGVREGVRGTIGHHLCERRHYTHVNPPRYRRSPRANHESHAMYHALKDNGVSVKFIAIPTADPVHDSDKDRVWLEWFDKHLK